jgi:hypothetical protein
MAVRSSGCACRTLPARGLSRALCSARSSDRSARATSALLEYARVPDDHSLNADDRLQIELPVGAVGPVPPFPLDDAPPERDDATPALLACRGQQALFAIRRDWTPLLSLIRGRRRAELPLTGAAQHVVEEFAQLRRNRRSPDYRKNLHTLIVLLYWLGIDTAIRERDVHDLAQLDPNLAARPVCQFLRARGLLLEDPELHKDADLVWIESTLGALPEPVASEVRTWVAVSRGQGQRSGPVRGYKGIRRYLAVLQPTLVEWTQAGVTSLRQITRDQVERAVDPLSGHAQIPCDLSTQPVQGPEAGTSDFPRSRAAARRR